MQSSMLYFAYGSNLRSAQMCRLCPGHCFRSIGRLASHRLAFTLSDEEWQGGVADLQPSAGHDVWGAIYEITASDLASLDAYEGFDTEGAPERNAYVRRKIAVTELTGRMFRDVWCYFVREEHGHVPPPGMYREALLEGARERGLPSKYIEAMQQAFADPLDN